MFRKWFIRNSSVQNKFLLSTLCLIIIPLGLFGIISFQVSKQSIESQVSQLNLRILGQISEKADMLLDDVISLSNTFYLNKEVNYGFTAPISPNSYEEVQIRSEFDRLLTSSIYSFANLKPDITLLGLNGLTLSTNSLDTKPSIQIMEQQDWYHAATEAKGQILWITEPIPGLATKGHDDRSVYAVRSSNRFESWAPIGLVIIRIDESTLKNLYAGSLDENQEIIIVNDGKIISSNNPDLASEDLKTRAYYEKIDQYESGFFVDHEMGTDQLIAFQTIGKTGWKLVSYTPTRTVLANINKIQTVVIVVFAIVVLLSFAASYYMARRLAIPIKRLSKDFGRVEAGDLTVRSPVYSEDEIGLLTQKFNQMVEKLKASMEDVKREQQNKRRAEIQTLQSQINPHFLYNTLASIRFMLYKHKQETVDSVIVALVRLLKQSISKEDEWIPVEEELDILKNYLYIQQIRQGDMLEVQYEIKEDILAYRTIKLILQPLVENAIFHGIEPKRGQGTIVIKGYLQDRDILFEVIDDGVGMEQSAVPPLPEEGANGQTALSHGGGLLNVHERIQLHFGRQYGVTLESAVNAGTKVTLRIPAFYKREDIQQL